MEEIMRTFAPSVANAPLTDSISFFKRQEFDYKSCVRVVFEGEQQ
jgi:hypothetical protein